jgi:drug/metabolite transporter (DMT)-like permease
MPLCGFLILMGLPVEFLPVMNSDVKTWFFLYQGIFTVFFPIAYLLLLKFGKSISSIHLHDRKERIPLFIGSLLFFIIDYIFVRMAPVRLPPIVYAMMLGGIISIMAAIAFTLKTKISIHAIGVAGVLGTLFAAGEHITDHFFMMAENPVFWPIVIVALLAGIISSARLALQAHTPLQIYMGLIVGFCALYFPVKFLIVI